MKTLNLSVISLIFFIFLEILTEEPQPQPQMPDVYETEVCLLTGKYGSETIVLKTKLPQDNIVQIDPNSSENNLLKAKFQALYEKCQHDKNFNLELLLTLMHSKKLHIEKTDLNSQPLGISGYVHYEDGRLEDDNSMVYDFQTPLINLIHVEENSNLRLIGDLLGFDKVFKVEKFFGKITSFYHPSDQENLVLGFSNLHIGVLNLKKSRVDGEKKLNLEKILDVSFDQKEPEDKIRFITGIPGTQVAILAPTRMEILKFDFINSKITKFPNPIDNIERLIIPFSKNRISEKNKLPNTKFIATAAFNHINFVGDYTDKSMKPLRFFTIRLPRYFLNPSLDGENPLTDKVNAIEFYGYYPKSQYYLLSNHELPYVYLYSTTFNKFDDYEEIISGIKTLNWIEETSLVFYSNGGSECGYWNVHQHEGNPERKIEKCQHDHSTALEFKMLVLDFGRGKQFNTPALINIPLIMLNKKTFFIGWEKPENGKKVNNITWPECKEPLRQEIDQKTNLSEVYRPYEEESQNQVYSFAYRTIYKDGIDTEGLSNAIFSGIRLCRKCREGVYRKVREWELYSDQEGENPMREKFGFYSKIFCKEDKKKFTIEEEEKVKAAVDGKKLFHQLSKCDVCTYQYFPYKKQWFHTYVLEGTDIQEPYDMAVNQTVLLHLDEFPEIEYTNKQTGEEEKYIKGGCATGFTTNDLGICQNCASFKFQTSSEAKKEDLDHFEKLKAWHCSNCYTHRTTRFYTHIPYYENIEPNFFFCLEFNPFGNTYFLNKYETIKSVRPTETTIEVSSSRVKYIYEPSLVSNWLNNPNATTYDYLNRISRYFVISSIYSSPLGTIYPFQNSNPQDCLLLKFIRKKNSGVSSITKDFRVLPGYSPKLAPRGSPPYPWQEKLEHFIFLSMNRPQVFSGEMDFNYSKVYKLERWEYLTNHEEFIYQCSGKCPLGYFYNLTSMSCLKCGYGCSECQEFDKCEKCKAGYRIIDHKCHRGCPDGYYTVLFNGRCKKCSEECVTCRDDLLLRKEEGFNGYCYECQQEGYFIDVISGKCIPKCEGERRRIEIKLDLKYCMKCDLEFCEICNFYEKNKCLKCQEGSVLDDVDGSVCKKEKISVWTIFGVAMLILGVLVLLAYVGFICFRKISKEKKKKPKLVEYEKTKNMNTELGTLKENSNTKNILKHRSVMAIDNGFPSLNDFEENQKMNKMEKNEQFMEGNK